MKKKKGGGSSGIEAAQMIVGFSQKDKPKVPNAIRVHPLHVDLFRGAFGKDEGGKPGVNVRA